MKAKEKIGMDKINEICISIMKLTDTDFKLAIEKAEEQRNYIHPLKMATQRKFNKLGESNLLVIEKLMDLKKIMKDGHEKSKS